MVETKEALLVNKLASMRVNTTEYKIIRNTLTDEGKVLLKKIRLKECRDRSKQKSIDDVDRERFDDTEDEIWMDIEGFENYSASSKGRVKNIISNKRLKPGIDGNGYKHVSSCSDKNKYSKTVHQLVATSFLNKKKMINVL